MIDLEIFRGKKVLLLSGPVGWFYYRLAKDLREHGAEVYKINFSGGEFFYYPFGALNYRKKPEELGDFLRDFVQKNRIDTVFLFNDCKEVHRIAKGALEGLVEFWVLEWGYIRPDFFTFERGGINGYSHIPKDWEFYKEIEVKPIKVRKVGSSYMHYYALSVIFFLAYMILRPFFPSSRLSYKNILGVVPYYLKTVFLQAYYSIKEDLRGFLEQFSGKFYFVPLQVHNDSQIKYHSDYKSIEEFIQEVMESFLAHAPKDTYLVFKHHPMDLGFKCYRKYIDKKAAELGIKDRVFYFKNGNIDSLLKHCIGCATINSTVGLTALRMYKPLIVKGRCVYNVKGIVFDGSLDEFWQRALDWRMDKELVDRFIYFLIRESQVNGSLHKRGPCRKTHTGACYTGEECD